MATTSAEIVTAVTAFITDYEVYIAAGLILGFATWAVKRFIKFGR
jgi:uncharacterized membrane protein (Fun14 family)